LLSSAGDADVGRTSGSRCVTSRRASVEELKRSLGFVHVKRNEPLEQIETFGSVCASSCREALGVNVDTRCCCGSSMRHMGIETVSFYLSICTMPGTDDVLRPRYEPEPGSLFGNQVSNGRAVTFGKGSHEIRSMAPEARQQRMAYDRF
jgi:hypothetical protein